VDDLVLLTAAREAKSRAYAPYSRFPVGAAVLTKKGAVYTGCNIENASLGLTVCAERAAVFNAVCAGERDLEALAVSADTPGHCRPCGACRQVLAEFSDDIRVIMGNMNMEYEVKTIKDLLPDSFKI